VREYLGDWLTRIHNFHEKELEHESLLEGGLKLYQAHMDVNHLQILLAVELLPENYVCGVEEHETLVLLRNFKQGCALSIGKDRKVHDFGVQLSVRLVSTFVLRVIAAAIVFWNLFLFLLLYWLEV
jgi:hypothetical protein